MKLTFEMMNNKKILVSYFPIGDTIVTPAVEWAGKFFENGTTVLEIGLPYEDPYLDGPIVADAMARALKNIDLEQAFSEIKEIRKAYPDKRIQVMTYMGNVEKYGCKQFAEKCKNSGVDAVLIPDANPGQIHELDISLKKYDIDNLRFAPYYLTDDIINDLKENATGYVYLQAVNGKTGASSGITDQIEKNNKTLRAAGIKCPLIPGFGISTPEHVKRYMEMGSDGVVVGSAIIKHIISGDGEAYIKSLSDAML